MPDLHLRMPPFLIPIHRRKPGVLIPPIGKLRQEGHEFKDNWPIQFQVSNRNITRSCLKKKKKETHRGGDPPASHSGNPERAFTELLAWQSQLETELTVACTDHNRAILLWKVSHTGIKAQIAIMPQRLGQPQELKNGHQVWLVTRRRSSSELVTLAGRQGKNSSPPFWRPSLAEI